MVTRILRLNKSSETAFREGLTGMNMVKDQISISKREQSKCDGNGCYIFVQMYKKGDKQCHRKSEVNRWNYRSDKGDKKL
jgi:hypothetical protein